MCPGWSASLVSPDGVEATYTGEPPDRADVAGVEDAYVGDGVLRLHVSGSPDPLLKVLAQAEVTAIQMREPSLEELFHAYYDETADAA